MQKPNLNLATPTPMSQSLVTVVVMATLGIWIVTILMLGYSLLSKRMGISQKLNSFLDLFEETPNRQNRNTESLVSGIPATLAPNESTTTFPTLTPTSKRAIDTVIKKKVVPTSTPAKYNQYTYPTTSIKTGSKVVPTFPPLQSGSSDFAKQVESEQARMHEEFEKMKAEICANSPSLCE